MRKLLPLLLVGFVLAGCGTTADDQWSAPGGSNPASSYPVPISVDVPSVNISAAVQPITMVSDALDVSALDAEPMDAGWYSKSAKVGQVGPMVLAAHINYNGPGAFGRLHLVKPGATVTVTGDDLSEKTYVIYQVDQPKKAQFPTEAVYGRVDQPEIRLITCGGVFDKTRHSYVDNFVAYGRLQDTR